MFKNKKIRGHRRIHDDIEKWKESNLELDIKNLEYSKREYCKVWVSPFSDISVTGSRISSPKGKNRKLILSSLLQIFDSWDAQLKNLKKPYYLAIWLFEPYIEKSQVVCVIDGMLNFYDITFFRPEQQLKMPTQNYGKLKEELDVFSWVYALDEHHFTNEDVEMTEDEYLTKEDYVASQKWYKRKLKSSPRNYTDEFNSVTYSVKKGSIWIGTKN